MSVYEEDSVYVDAPAGTPIRVILRAEDIEDEDMRIDMRTVTAVTLDIERPDRTSAVWTTTLGTATEHTLSVTHVLASGDLTRPGPYRVRAAATYPAGTGLSVVMPLKVKAKFDR